MNSVKTSMFEQTFFSPTVEDSRSAIQARKLAYPQHTRRSRGYIGWND